MGTYYDGVRPQQGNVQSTDLEALSPRVLKDIIDFLIENKGEVRNETEAREYMRTMTVTELFDAYLCWNGIIGFTDSIWNAVQCISKSRGL